jgi:hypothetical protein
MSAINGRCHPELAKDLARSAYPVWRANTTIRAGSFTTEVVQDDADVKFFKLSHYP